MREEKSLVWHQNKKLKQVMVGLKQIHEGYFFDILFFFYKSSR